MADSSNPILAEVTSLNKDEGTTMNSFMCPITHQLFIDPVIASDGFSYERSAIDQWFKSSDKSPVTGAKITRTLVPNHALRNAVQEIYPQQAELFQSRISLSATMTTLPAPEQSSATPIDNNSGEEAEFAFSKEEIFDLTRSRFGVMPAPGAVYYGLFEQQFQEGEFVAKSTWTIRLEFDSLEDYVQPPVLTAIVVWRKHVQAFSKNLDTCTEDLRQFANQLNQSVGGTFTSKIRGSFDSNTGKLEMYAYEAQTVGNGFYTLLLGQDGETLDGIFYVRNFMDASQPSIHGRGVFRLRRYLD